MTGNDLFDIMDKVGMRWESLPGKDRKRDFKAAQKARKRVLKSILKKKKQIGLFAGFAVVIYFFVKKFGISVSLFKCWIAAVIISATAVFTVSAPVIYISAKMIFGFTEPVVIDIKDIANKSSSEDVDITKKIEKEGIKNKKTKNYLLKIRLKNGKVFYTKDVTSFKIEGVDFIKFRTKDSLKEYKFDMVYDITTVNGKR